MELNDRNKLILDNLYLVEIQINKKNKIRRLQPFDRDDLRSEGYVALIEAANFHANNARDSFPAYASRCIANAINGNIGRSARRQLSSLEECDESAVAYYHNNGVESAIDELDFDGSEKEILRLYVVDRLTYEEIGERLGVSKSRIAQRMRQCAEKLL